MSAENFEHVRELFHAAVELDDGARDAYLAKECGADAELLAQVQQLIAEDQQDTGFLAAPAVASVQVPDEQLPEQIGPFRILQLLGKGSMGAVYAAEQERPRRVVALKVLHASISTPELSRRFELEAELLARLDHPGIARILEVGTSEVDGVELSWLSMERVEGVTLDQYIANSQPNLDERLELVARTCEAVHHAHVNGIVHRDLKPANVLVTAAGEPKVLDFGVARAVDVEVQRDTLRTSPGMIVGTLQYMSPEQAAADATIDTRSDVYSLGVMLYELVAGAPPVNLSGLSLHHALAALEQGALEPLTSKLFKVSGDLRVVAGAALERDRERRYASAAELARELRHVLNREPIAAQPPTSMARASLFVRRHLQFVIAATLVFLALSFGLAATLWQVAEKTRAEQDALQKKQQAEVALATAEAVNTYLLQDVLGAAAPEVMGRDARIIDALRPAALRVGFALKDQPRVAAEVLVTLSSSMTSLGLLEEGASAAARAADLLAQLDEPVPELEFRLRGAQVEGYLNSGELDVAFREASSLHGEWLTRFGERDKDTLHALYLLAVATSARGDWEGSSAITAGLVETARSALGPNHEQTLDYSVALAHTYDAVGKPVEARELLDATYELQLETLGPSHSDTLHNRITRARFSLNDGDNEGAERSFETLLSTLRPLYGEHHPYLAEYKMYLAIAIVRQGRIEEAMAILAEVITDLEESVGAAHALTLEARRRRIDVLRRDDRFEAAIGEAEALVAIHRGAEQVDSLILSSSLTLLGRCHEGAQDYPAAEAAMVEAIELIRTSPGASFGYLSETVYFIGTMLRKTGAARRAIPYLREALELDLGAGSPDHFTVRNDRYELGLALIDADEADEAVQVLRQSVASAERTLPAQDRRLANNRTALGRALAKTGERDEAQALLQAALEAYESSGNERAADVRAELARLNEAGVR